MRYRLICFDLDGTLVEHTADGHHYWGTLHRTFRPKDGERINRERYDAFMRNEFTEMEWVDMDLEGFQALGKTRKDFEAAARSHQLITGAREAILELHRRGYKLAVISGALTILIDTLFPNHPFSDVFANDIEFDDDGRMVSWVPTKFDFGTKHLALQELCRRENLALGDLVFVGDGENDIEALRKAGLGIAFCPKSEKVARAADVVVEKRDVREILNFL